MSSQILKFVDFTKIQKSRYLESKTLFLLQIKKFINYKSMATFNPIFVWFVWIIIFEVNPTFKWNFINLNIFAGQPNIVKILNYLFISKTKLSLSIVSRLSFGSIFLIVTSVKKGKSVLKFISRHDHSGKGSCYWMVSMGLSRPP